MPTSQTYTDGGTPCVIPLQNWRYYEYTSLFVEWFPEQSWLVNSGGGVDNNCFTISNGVTVSWTDWPYSRWRWVEWSEPCKKTVWQRWGWQLLGLSWKVEHILVRLHITYEKALIKLTMYVWRLPLEEFDANHGRHHHGFHATLVRPLRMIEDFITLLSTNFWLLNNIKWKTPWCNHKFRKHAKKISSNRWKEKMKHQISEGW